ncbi:MAG: hypothetical protein IGR93_00770 [Hydrococcus sp. C42_A2020_068]|uniref:hypothetical protein n=1 Tax=Pleurocapsa sp. PCC 7327 TaxID=118163 RepID=UPI00029FB588|nr:hypothetical protein [Pleurocapsa sp. PCC 7327]AFY78627.1 hypothetical protein Ple7327_3419 [Pleurocapsa sp. PCC 7327]MBF2018666.1 hypothetical protein [Hydrococcus sp. C42_A2020_068]
MQYLLYAIAFYLLILVLPYLIAYLQFRKSILQYPKYEICSDNSLPVHLTELFQKPIKDLEPFGFEPCSYLLVEQMQKLDPQTT